MDGVDSEGSTASVTLYGDQSISAVFVESEFSPVILINELLAANESINTDETGEYEDWVELYNTTNSSSIKSRESSFKK